ncbi:hypothetical protein JCM10207_005289 [Rhodosporidiobolus poonsookiae]
MRNIVGLSVAPGEKPRPSTSSNPRNPTPVAHSSPTSIHDLALSAFSEVESIRTSIDGLRNKLTALESVLVAAFSTVKQDPIQAAAVAESLAERHRQLGANGHLKTEQISPQMAMAPPSLPLPTPPQNYTLPELHALHANGGLPSDILVGTPPSRRPSLSSSFLPSGSAGSSTLFTLPPIDPARAQGTHDYPSSFLPVPLDPALTSTAPASASSGGNGVPGLELSGPSSGSASTAGSEGRSADDLREEEVAASLSLEFMALGRNRALNGSQASAQNPHTSPAHLSHLPLPSLVFDAIPRPPHPYALYSTASSLASILPPFADCHAIVEYAIDYTGWYHSTVHGPTFRAEVQEFWALPAPAGAEERLEKASPAWLALLFAQMSCGIKHMTTEQLGKIGYGLTEDDARTLFKTYLDASIACLYRSNFLENHQLHAIQAIAVLVITCQDGAFSNLFPMLLSLGICLAQDLGLHRLPSEEAWAASVEGQPLEQRAKSLITYEIQKRCFWALTSQDWFSIPYRRTTLVLPTQVTTPLPSNARDEDLMTGVLVNRPPSECTVVSTLLIWIQVARILQQVFQHLDENPTPSYEIVLELDAQLQKLLSSVPPWLSSDSTAPNLPPNANWMRSTFAISSNHKVLTLHRAFFRRFEPSRKRALDASRAILREAARVGDSRMWTVPYHISAAASVVCLDLFQRGSSPSVLHQERDEIHTALSTLRSLSSFSAIASRGAALIENLLHEESRLPPLPPRSSDGLAADDLSRSTKKRKLSQSLPGSTEFGRMSKLLARDEAHTPSGNRASLSHLLTSPGVTPGLTPNGLVFPAPPGVDGLDTSPFSTSSALDGGEGIAFRDPFAGATGREGDLGMPNGLGLVDDLPPSYVSAFLHSGFDPLDGAITSPAPGLPWLDIDLEGRV